MQASLRYAVRGSSLGSESLADCVRIVSFLLTAVAYTRIRNSVKVFLALCINCALCARIVSDASGVILGLWQGRAIQSDFRLTSL